MTNEEYHKEDPSGQRQASSFKPFTPEERASFLAFRFGSTLDWSSRILVEINYPVEEIRWFVDAVQGICKGKEQRIAHSTLATRAQRFKNPAQAKSLAKRAIATNQEWSRLHKRMIFDIEAPKPGEREGKDKRARTRYTDYLTPVVVWAQEAEQRAKKANAAQWKKDSKHRFTQRQMILASAIEMLPSFGLVEDMPKGTQPKDPSPLSISEYVKQREDRLLAENARVLSRLTEGDLIDAAEIDDRLASLEVFYSHVRGEIEKKFQSARDVLLGLRDTRLVRSMNLGDVVEGDESDAEIPATKGVAHVPLSEVVLSGNNSYKGVAGVPLSVEPVLHPKSVVQEPAKVAAPENENAESTLEWALWWASQGIPVFPLHEVYDGICTCTCTRKKCGAGTHGCGSECDSKGKHPRTGNGVDNATTDTEQIKAWWRKYPTANIGGAMGGEPRILAVDIDPRSGGDASLHDLTEAHSGQWLETKRHKTGSGGWHLFYTIPEGVTFRKGKLAPGIDLKYTGGYVVLPPSIHLSGSNYAIEEQRDAASAPVWMLEELTRTPDVQPSVVVNFQERQQKSNGTAARFFGGGERNDGLRDVACGRWTHGYATDANDLFEQMREVRNTRCEFVPGDPPPDDTWLWSLVQRTTQKFARGERAQ